VSLFSGVGGFELGFERAGIRTILQAESDPQCRAVLERRFPEIPRLKDVRDVGHPLGVDLVYGGFPCQDVSLAGRRRGLSGARSSLWFEFERVLRDLRPRWCVVENVPGLLSSHRGRDFATILLALDELGYGVAWRTLDARWFGVAQRRKRVFLVGCLGDPHPAQQVLAVCESCGGYPAARRRAWPTAGDKADGGADDIGYAVSSQQKHYDREQTYVLATPLTASDGHHGWRGPRGDGQDNLIVSSGVRRLTPLECERLMGWPDGWTDVDGLADTPRYRMIGNGVVAPVAEWLGHRLVAVDAHTKAGQPHEETDPQWTQLALPPDVVVDVRY
jgi:DNA (cytosine-5)-methyltransferase 1